LKQLQKSQAAFGKQEQAFSRELLEGFSQFVTVFIEASKNFIFDVLHKN
jgi:hypothetical protein